jgi:predicted DNA-binding transcriptional regulator AlpA
MNEVQRETDVERSDPREPKIITSVEPVAVDDEGAAALLGLSRRGFQDFDRRGLIGPQPVKLGRAKRWPVDELRRWVAAGCPPRVEWQRMRDPAPEEVIGRG